MSEGNKSRKIMTVFQEFLKTNQSIKKETSHYMIIWEEDLEVRKISYPMGKNWSIKNEGYLE